MIFFFTATKPAVLLLVISVCFSCWGYISLSYASALVFIVLCLILSDFLSENTRNNWIQDSYDWEKEIVLVTGGADGIGGHMVKLLDQLGITTIVLDVQNLQFDVSANVHYFKCDIRSPEELATAATNIRSQVGHPTVIVNNAAVVRGKTLLDAEPDDIKLTFDVNTLGAFWTMKTFLPDLVAKDHGMIVLVSSCAAWLTLPHLVDYCSSKAALLALHEGISAELRASYQAPKVRTVIVHPGYTQTSLFTGFDQALKKIFPPLNPEFVSRVVVDQILRGRSGELILPPLGAILYGARALPYWLSHWIVDIGKSSMIRFSGRQVFQFDD